MEVAESVTTTGSRNPSPSLPEGANVSLEPEEAPMEVEKESSSTLASNQATISPLVTHQTSAVGGEACKKEEEEGASGEREKSVESERSSECGSVKEGAVVTEAMLKEEQRLHNTESRESSSERDKVSELKDMVEHQRYLRLQHLLERSTIYSKFMLKQMVEQREKEKKEDEKNARHKKIVTNPNTDSEEKSDKGQADGRMTRSGAAALKSPEVKAQQKGKGGGKKRGRKRKAEESSYKISDFVDSQGQLKKRKLDSGEACSGGKAVSKKRRSAGEELEEERYFKGQLIPAQQPKLFTGGIMRSYQIDGMEWIKVLYENGVNGILGDEMGLGKTIQCISVIAHMIEMGIRGPFLVATPLSTVPNWVSEFKKFTPTIPVVLYHGTQQERLQLRRSMFKPPSNKKKKKGSSNQPILEETLPVVVTSYEICMRDQQYLMNRSWKFLVVDEGHRIKNLNCKLIKALKSYDAANRLLLTGTPLQNNLAELWSLLNFLLPDIFDDLNSFQSWFDFDTNEGDDVREKIIAQEREQNVLKTLHQILTPFLLRRLKTDVEFSLPPKKEVLVYAPLTAYQEKYYKSLLNNTIFDMIAKEEKKKITEMNTKGKENVISTEGGEEMECEELSERRRDSRLRKSRAHYSQLSDSQFEQILSGQAELEEFVPKENKKEEKKLPVLSVKDIKMTSVFTMLRKCCNHPYLLEFPLTPEGDFLVNEQIVTSCGKIMLLDRMLSPLIERGHKTLIFSQFTSMLDVLEDYLDLRSLVYSRLDGAMAFAERQKQMTMFRESPDCHVFLLSTRAGGLGINLTNADTVIIYDSDWNPQCDLQAQDRCHRIGQTKPVMVYRFVTANTIDQRIVERAASKRRLEKMVIHKGKFKGKANDFDFSLDDLVELLHSVDHHKVVDNKDAVITDEQLEALLDRTLTSKEKKESSTSSHPADEQNVFKVIEERDTQGNVIRQDADSAPTTDTWHIVKESEASSDAKAEGCGQNSESSSSPGAPSKTEVASAIDSTTDEGHTETSSGANSEVNASTKSSSDGPTSIGEPSETDVIHVAPTTDSTSDPDEVHAPIPATSSTNEGETVSPVLPAETDADKVMAQDVSDSGSEAVIQTSVELPLNFDGNVESVESTKQCESDTKDETLRKSNSPQPITEEGCNNEVEQVETKPIDLVPQNTNSVPVNDEEQMACDEVRSPVSSGSDGSATATEEIIDRSKLADDGADSALSVIMNED